MDRWIGGLDEEREREEIIQSSEMITIMGSRKWQNVKTVESGCLLELVVNILLIP